MSRPRTEITKDDFSRYYARMQDCTACALIARCTPNQDTQTISRISSTNARNRARGIATTDAYAESSRRRKELDTLFAHLSASRGSIACAAADRTERRMNFSSQPAARTSGSWPS